MVPITSILFMIVSGLICAGVPIGGLVYLSTRKDAAGAARYPDVWRPFVCGALAFTVSQLLTRIPLHILVLPHLGAVGQFFLSVPVASYTAGLFEETGRLVVMVLLLKGFHRWIDGVAFGLGHGGIEAILLVGLTQLNNVILALALNLGLWQTVAGSLPADVSDMLKQTLITTNPALFLVSGIERSSAISLHIGCSLIVLWGVHVGKKLLAWVVAVLLHGTANLTTLFMLTLPRTTGILATEGSLLALAVVIWVVAWRVRGAYAPTIETRPPTTP